MKKTILLCLMMSIVFTFAGCSSNKTKSEPYTALNDYADSGYAQFQMPEKGEEVAVIETNYGIIKARLFPQYAPKASENFSTHAKDGYYNNLTFHRVSKGFVIQGGDPKGNGMGGESIWGKGFGVEIDYNLHHIRGALCMAMSSQPDSIGSQFYIVTADKLDTDWTREVQYYLDNPDEEIDKTKDGQPIVIGDIMPTPFSSSYLTYGGTPMLDLRYTVFGQVFEGMNIVDEIAACQTRGETPVDTVQIISIKMEEYK